MLFVKFKFQKRIRNIERPRLRADILRVHNFANSSVLEFHENPHTQNNNNKTFTLFIPCFFFIYLRLSIPVYSGKQLKHYYNSLIIITFEKMIFRSRQSMFVSDRTTNMQIRKMHRKLSEGPNSRDSSHISLNMFLQYKRPSESKFVTLVALV